MKSSAVVDQTILNAQDDDYLPIEIESFIRAKTVKRLAKNTLRFYSTYLSQFNTWCDRQGIKYVRQVTPNALRDYLLFLGQTHNAGGIKTYYSSIRAFCKWYWLENDMPGQLLFDKVPAPKDDHQHEVVGRLTRDKLNALFRACGDDWLGVRNKTILYILASTGMRAGELLSIKREDAFAAKSEIFIPAGNTKTRRPRYVFFSTPTRLMLRRLLKYPNKAPWLFVDRTQHQLSYNALRLALKRLCKAAHIDLVSPHDFRRFFIYTSLSRNVDLVSLSRMVGHEGLDLLKRYSRQQDSNDIRDKYTDPVKE